MLSLHPSDCAGSRRWPVCQQSHARLLGQSKRRSSPQLHHNPLLRLFQSARVRPALALSVLTGRSYALNLESGKLYKTEVMNRSVAQIREELAARSADTRGIKKVIAERLFSILQDEAEQQRQARKAAAASPMAEPRAKAPPRRRRTPAQMAEKLQLRSTSEPAKRAKRAKHVSLKDRVPVPTPAPEQLPGARAAQMVRLAMMSKIAKASMVSAQQKEQQEAQQKTEVQPGNLPQQAKQGSAQQAAQSQQAQQAQRDNSQHGGPPLTEVAWESDANASSANIDTALAPSTGLAQEEEHSPAQRLHHRHADAALSDSPMHGTSAADSGAVSQPTAQAEIEDSLLMQRQGSNDTATTSGSDLSNGSSSGSSTGFRQDPSSSSGIQGGESDVSSSSSYNSSTIWKASSMDQEAVNSNATGMQFSFLGTASSVDCKSRSPSCVAIRAQKAVMLFDCGEDAQRQLLKQPQIVHGKINRIFVTDLGSTNIYGIPGMLCTLSWARERGFENADIPLHVYGPPGLADYIRTMLLLSDTYSMVPILIHEFQTTACNQEPEMILKRARLYRVLLPPNQLNSNGYYDGTLDEAFLARYDRKKKGGRADLRASTKQIQLPSPGDPSRQGLQPQDMSWTISCDQETVVTAFPLPPCRPARPCWGYSLQEADRAGSLDVVKAQQLRVFPGPAYGALKAGESVQAEDGTWVTPQQVVGPNQPGRKLVILGQTNNPMAALKWAQGADSLLLGPSPQVQVGHDISSQAATDADARGYAAFVQAVNATQLVLTRLDDSPEADSAVRSVQQLCSDQTDVQEAYDHMVVCLERRKPSSG